MTTALAGFSRVTREWFASAFDGPTAAQEGTWSAVAAGRHVLTVAPTGSGKTLAAFLSSLDRLASEPIPDDPTRRCRVLYVSPLKALAVDIDRNLRSPLAGIQANAGRLGTPPPDIRVGTRTGDTPAAERRDFTRRPPDILITTPESLFLLLTSAARESLRGVETVIVDEVHAVCATKRGVHLSLSLERLDALLERPAQRIGLSATVRPVEEVARFLGGEAPVQIVQPPAAKTIALDVIVPVEDMTAYAVAESSDDPDPDDRKSIWPAVEERVFQLIRTHQSTIVFTNGRRGAERLTSKLNDLGAELATGEPPEPMKRFPAEIIAESGIGQPVPDDGVGVVARAHHGSVSKEQRAGVEEALKSGRLPAVVATSSLELGIDMGAVDLVVQIEAPPSVASGLQRVGRAGHQVGAVSHGVILPKYRGDLVSCAVVAERMTAGAIEELTYPRNALDVLAQQIVAMVAMDSWTVDEVERLVRGAAPYASLPRSALEAVLDMLAGRYPSDAFAELRPRLTWDRDTGVLTARTGAQRLAVTSGGTIPDRGLFGVFLAGEETGQRSGRRRVGELDEEMVYESRVGDVFLLGSSSWRITDITPDQVLVVPAPGQPGRMPFWKGDSPGRPLELGRAVGAFVREMRDLTAAAARDRARTAGLDDFATVNLLRYLNDQAEATGALPDDRTIVVERFRDELGDWRICVHSPFGDPVNAPWALAMAARLRERYGIDAQAVHSDDGIVLRLPDMDEVPPADFTVFDPDEIETIITAELTNSAAFAARFRECAARALLLPRRRPGRRAPLWQQRQRSAQLLAVAGDYGEFPIVLEAMRECLHDVFDVPGLVEIMRELGARKTRLIEVESAQPSPFARSLLFGYVGSFMYEGDSPLAEQRAQALALDTTLLAELLGRAELRELLDPDVLAETEERLQRRTPDRHARDADETADLLRVLGGLSTVEAVERGATEEWLLALERARRVIQIRVAGDQRWIAVEDAGRVRDALGVALPVGVPTAFTSSVRDPVGDLVSAYARTHGPFTAVDCARRLGLGVAVVTGTLERLAGSSRVLAGEFRPGGHGTEWCDAEVLRTLRRRSLAALRKEVEPAPPSALGEFLPAWQGVTTESAQSGGRGTVHKRQSNPDALLEVLDVLQGVPIPASALERLVLPARLPDYAPAQLDELTAAGEVLWAGCGSLPGNDGWIALAYADQAALLLPPVTTEIFGATGESGTARNAGTARNTAAGGNTGTGGYKDTAAAKGNAAAEGIALAEGIAAGEDTRAATSFETAGLTVPTGSGGDPGLDPTSGAGLSAAVLSALAGGNALFFRALSDAVGARLGVAIDDGDLITVIWDLVWAGYLTNDTVAPLRAHLSGRPSATPSRPVGSARAGSGRARSRLARARPRLPSRGGPPTVAGRWSLVPPRETDKTLRAHALTDALLERYGVLTRGSVAAEHSPGGFGELYPVLSAWEEVGRVRRGYFVAGLGGAQFALTGAVDRLRQIATSGERRRENTAAEPDYARAAAHSATRDRKPALVLAATDPANPYGAALDWPDREVDAESDQAGPPTGKPGARAHRPGRKAGALVVLADGELVLYVEKGGRTLLSFTTAPEPLADAAAALAQSVHNGLIDGLSVERADGSPVTQTPIAPILEQVGFRATPRGLRLRA